MMTKLLKYWSLFLAAVAAYAAWILITTPNANNIKSCLVTKNYKVSLCEKNKNYARLSQISKNLKNLVLIAEDSNFYFHSGFDWGELKNSFESNLNLFRFARGGSTITQQLAKNVFLTFEKTYSRKIREAILAHEIERILSKNEIYEKYLNVIELGPGLYGVHAASWHYFNKPASDLNILEAAFITYLIPNPKVHSLSFKNQKLSAYARKRILDLCYRMYRYHRISSDQYEAAREVVDYFPWRGLSEVQIARIKGLPFEQGTTDEVLQFVTDEKGTAGDHPLPPLDEAPVIEEEDESATN